MPVKINIPLKACAECGQMFRPRPDRAAKIRFCQHKCFKKFYARTTQAKRVEKVCIRCGKPFSVIRAQASQLHCSMKCARYRITVTCPRCGRVYERHRYKGLLKVEKGCGRACTNRRVIKQCLRCGKNYECKWNRIKISRYCSASCRSSRPKTYFDPETTHRTCKQCGKVKPLRQFKRSKKCIGGRTSKCSKCATNIENKRQDGRAYYARHREKLIPKMVRWNRQNPDKVKTYAQKVRAVRIAAEGSFTPQEWNDLLDLYGHKCLACGVSNKKLSADHVIPLSRRGTNYISNIQPLCRSCNSRKNAKTIDYRLFATPSGRLEILPQSGQMERHEIE